MKARDELVEQLYKHDPSPEAKMLRFLDRLELTEAISKHLLFRESPFGPYETWRIDDLLARLDNSGLTGKRELGIDLIKYTL